MINYGIARGVMSLIKKDNEFEALLQDEPDPFRQKMQSILGQQRLMMAAHDLDLGFRLFVRSNKWNP